jgi:hypothetical protein
MSNATWFKIFSENGKMIVVAYAGSVPVSARRTTNKTKLCDFLNQHPSAHNIHVATAQENERIPRVRIFEDDDVDDPRWIPWAKTPKNDPKLTEIYDSFGHPNMQGKYRNGWPEGIIYHHTAGRPDPYGTCEFLWNSYPCLVVGRDGFLYQTFPLDEWSYHSGTYHHQYCVGVEVVGAGLLKPITIEGVSKYAPWFAFDQNTGELVEPEACFNESECRFINGNQVRTKGWYQKFTPEQEQTVERLCMYLKLQRPDIFSCDKIKGHDEAVAEDGTPYEKNDPGGSLSIDMNAFRDKIKSQTA